MIPFINSIQENPERLEVEEWLPGAVVGLGVTADRQGSMLERSACAKAEGGGESTNL